MQKFITPTIFLFLTTGVTACDDEKETGDSEADTDTDSDTDTDTDTDSDTDVDTVHFEIHLYQWPEWTPVDGAELCWRDGLDEWCTFSNVGGEALIQGVPANTAGRLDVSSELLYPLTMPIILGDSNIILAYGADTPAFLKSLYAQAGIALDPSLATLSVQTTPGGSTVSLSPASGQGPFYLSDDGIQIDLAAKKSGKSGIAYYFGVEPSKGAFSLLAEVDGVPCTAPAYGVELPVFGVVAGSETWIGVACPK